MYSIEEEADRVRTKTKRNIPSEATWFFLLRRTSFISMWLSHREPHPPGPVYWRYQQNLPAFTSDTVFCCRIQVYTDLGWQQSIWCSYQPANSSTGKINPFVCVFIALWAPMSLPRRVLRTLQSVSRSVFNGIKKLLVTLRDYRCLHFCLKMKRLAEESI